MLKDTNTEVISMNDNTQNNTSQNNQHDTQIINGQVVAGESHTAEATNETLTNFIAQNTNRVVSEGGPTAKSITKLLKQGGEVVGYELSDGSRVSEQVAIQMAMNNELQHVGVSTSKTGSAYIRSLADGDESNNLSNLPSESVESI